MKVSERGNKLFELRNLVQPFGSSGPITCFLRITGIIIIIIILPRSDLEAIVPYNATVA